MRTSWVIERYRILALIAVILVLGGLSGQWAISILLPSAVYIGWLLLQLHRLEKWLLEGSKPRNTPETSGAWESVVSQVLQIRKQDKRMQKRLARLAKGYRNTVKALPDATIVVNDKLEIDWSNQVATRYLGIDPKRDLGYRITNLIRDPVFIDYLANPAARALEYTSPVNPDLTLAIRVIQYGQNKQRLILGRDVSERVRVRNALKAFISNASHELRSPLTVTSGYIDLIREDPSLPAHMVDPLEQMHEQTGHMAQLINNLLLLSQLEGDTLAEYEGRSLDVPALIRQLVQNLASSGISRDHQIELDLDPRLGLLGVRHEINSICSNLIDNAIKYTPAGTRIDVGWFVDDQNQPCLVVSDQGPGFEAGHIARLTQRFYRIDRPQQQAIEGTGLGLAIVKHAVIHHGGQLEIESPEKTGASFRICFPGNRRVKLERKTGS